MSDYNDRSLVAGEMIGYRGFRIEQADPIAGDLLKAPYMHTPWLPGVNTAVCKRQAIVISFVNLDQPIESKPISCLGFLTKECSCGFYARTALPAPQYWSDYDYRYGRPLGVIRAWGKIVAGEIGFRAEHAEIVAVYSSNPDINLERIGKYYKVPTFTTQVDLLAQFPPTQLAKTDG